MAQGSMKIARELLSLEPTAIVELFTLYPDYKNKKEVSFNFHNGSLFGGDLIWQGVRYSPMPIEIEGFESDASATLPRPKLRVANKEMYISELLDQWDDFISARIFRKRTFVKFLDDENFDGGNPFGEADPTAELTNQVYVVSQKSQENKVFVELELSTPLDLETNDVNSRRILSNYCYWDYRGEGCGYKGVPIQTVSGTPFPTPISGFDLNTSTTDPTGGVKLKAEGEIELNHAIDLNESRKENFIHRDPKEEYKDENVYCYSNRVWVENKNIRIHDPKGLKDPEPMVTYYICKTGAAPIAKNEYILHTGDPNDPANISGKSPLDHPEYWVQDGCNKSFSSCKLRFGEDDIPFGGFPGTDGFQFRANSQ